MGFGIEFAMGGGVGFGGKGAGEFKPAGEAQVRVEKS